MDRWDYFEYDRSVLFSTRYPSGGLVGWPVRDFWTSDGWERDAGDRRKPVSFGSKIDASQLPDKAFQILSARRPATPRR
jgi:hypothetical protein